MSLTHQKIVTKNLTAVQGGRTCLDGKVKVCGEMDVCNEIRMLNGARFNFPDSKCLEVGTEEYPTINDALAVSKGLHDQCTTIKIPPGEYCENLKLEKFSSSWPIQNRDFNNDDQLTNTFQGGLMILGDTRPYITSSFVNGIRRPALAARQREYELELNPPVAGPFRALLASNFGGLVPSATSWVELELIQGTGPNPTHGVAPIINDLTNNAAVIDRGSITFVLKCTNAEGAGAEFAVVLNNQGGDQNISMGGGPAGVTIPCVDLTQNDGIALKAAMLSNPGLQARLVNPSGGAYDPPFGTNYGTVQLSHPGGDRTKIQVDIVDTPVADSNILAPPVLSNPDFPGLGYVVGDTLFVADPNLLGNDIAVEMKIVGFESSGSTDNIFVLDGEVDANLDITYKGASVTVMPNVSVKGSDLNTNVTCVFNGVSAGVLGIWFKENTAFPQFSYNYHVAVTGGIVALSNCAMTDSSNLMANGAQLFVEHALVGIYDSYRDTSNRSMFIHGNTTSVSISNNGALTGGHLTTTNGRGSGLSASNCNVSTTSMTLTGCGFNYLNGPSGLLAANGARVRAGQLHVSDVWGTGITIDGSAKVLVDQPDLLVQCCYKQAGGFNDVAGIVINGSGSLIVNRPSKFNDTDVLDLIQPDVIVRDNYQHAGPFDELNTGILLKDNAHMTMPGDLLLTNNDVDLVVLNNAKLLVGPSSTWAPNNRRLYSASGVLDHAFGLHALNAAGPLALTLDPEATRQGGVRLYHGKTYRLYSAVQGAHTLTLDNGAFIGLDTGTVATFANLAAGEYIEFYVVDDSTVLVTALNGVTIA